MKASGRQSIPLRDLPTRCAPELRGIAVLLGAVKEVTDPTPVEKAWLWDGIFQEYEHGLADGQPEREWRRRVLAFLEVHAPGLGGTAAGLRRTWQRNIREWIANGRTIDAVRDGRSRSRQGPPLPQADKDALTAAAVMEAGGRLSQAWRMVRRRGGLSEETDGRFAREAARKDYVPAAVRREVSPMLPALCAYHRGLRKGKLEGAYIIRDWSGVQAGDWYQADDVTLPVYYFVPDGDWWRLTRGQCLVMIDLRSRRVLDFVLIDEKSYDSLRIRRLMNRVCDRYGLPRRGFYFEGGIWERSKLVTGGDSSEAPGTAEVETGFRSLGLQFRHARTPRAKPIERVLGLAQDLMEGEPGYAGRNEIVDRFERVHRAKLDVVARRRSPEDAGFHSAAAWFERLHAIFEQYNQTRMDRGQATEGLSPDEAWERFQAVDDPLAKLPAEARHLLATHRVRRMVTKNGIRLSVGKRTFIYRGEGTAGLRGTEATVWFDPEDPSFCTITDDLGRNPIVVPLAPDLPAMDATRDEIEAAMASVAAHERPIRERYSRLRTQFLPAVRANRIAPSVAELGREMVAQRDALKAEKADRRATSAAVRRDLETILPADGAAALAEAAAENPEQADAWRRLSKLLEP